MGMFGVCRRLSTSICQVITKSAFTCSNSVVSDRFWTLCCFDDFGENGSEFVPVFIIKPWTDFTYYSDDCIVDFEQLNISLCEKKVPDCRNTTQLTFNNLLKVNKKNTRKGLKCVWKFEKLTTKTSEGHQWRRSSVFFVNCEHISHFFLVFL